MAALNHVYIGVLTSLHASHALIAAVGDFIAVEARFNSWMADQKDILPQAPFLSLIERYEQCVNVVDGAFTRFQADHDAAALTAELCRTKDEVIGLMK